MWSNLSIALLRQSRIEDAIKVDLKIINDIDPTFHKSYARLITSYKTANKKELALQICQLLKINFSDDIIQMYQGVMDSVEN